MTVCTQIKEGRVVSTRAALNLNGLSVTVGEMAAALERVAGAKVSGRIKWLPDAALQTIVGGNISLFTSMCEKTREDALELMMQHAAEHGANAVLGVRYDANEVMQGVTEVLAYGSAVVVEPNV